MIPYSKLTSRIRIFNPLRLTAWGYCYCGAYAPKNTVLWWKLYRSVECVFFEELLTPLSAAGCFWSAFRARIWNSDVVSRIFAHVRNTTSLNQNSPFSSHFSTATTYTRVSRRCHAGMWLTTSGKKRSHSLSWRVLNTKTSSPFFLTHETLEQQLLTVCSCVLFSLSLLVSCLWHISLVPCTVSHKLEL